MGTSLTSKRTEGRAAPAASPAALHLHRCFSLRLAGFLSPTQDALPRCYFHRLQRTTNDGPSCTPSGHHDARGHASCGRRSPSSSVQPTEFAKTLPGITDPLGFFDPLGFCAADGASQEQVSEGKVRFYREVELKHCRVAMLAALGF